MAKQIEFIHSSSVHRAEDGLRSRFTWITQTPPVPIDKLICIRIDFMIETEDANVMRGIGSEKRWRLLAPRIAKPEGMSLSTAVVFAEAIWLDTIMGSVSGHPNVVSEFFRGALSSECDRYDEKRLSDTGVHLDWTTFDDIGKEAGIDWRMMAWLDGVPLEHVLAE